MSKSPWGNIGAWAEEAERAEAEERESAEKASAGGATAAAVSSFPSLKESLSTGKQKKKTRMTLQEFTMQQHSNSQGLTAEEMLSLPTGPKQRSADDLRSGRLGGGFSNYGSRIGSSVYGTPRPREVGGRRSYGYEEDERKGMMMPSLSRASEFNQPSRADEVSDWNSMKKPSSFEYGRLEVRPAGRYSGGPGIASRADEVDNWVSMKKPSLRTIEQRYSSSSFQGASETERDGRVRNSQTTGSGFSKAEADNWRRNEGSLLEPPRNDSLVIEKVNKPNPFGAARPREEVLAEKGLDWKKLDLQIEEKKPLSVGGTSRPVSSHSSRPESSRSSRTEGLIPPASVNEAIEKQKPKVNPFGDAKPREVLLEEKGLDWRKIDLDLEHRGVDRSETDEEKKLKGEIEYLRKELLEKSGEEKLRVQEQLLQREQDLEELVRKLDDKVHYSQKIFDRPGSGSSRSASFSERPPSASGSYEGPRGGYAERRPPSQSGTYNGRQSGFHERPHSRSGSHSDMRNVYPPRSSFTREPADVNYSERPNSRGTSNSWTRPNDGRRSFQNDRRRGFPDNRDVDRSGSRW